MIDTTAQSTEVVIAFSYPIESPCRNSRPTAYIILQLEDLCFATVAQVCNEPASTFVAERQ